MCITLAVTSYPVVKQLRYDDMFFEGLLMSQYIIWIMLLPSIVENDALYIKLQIGLLFQFTHTYSDFIDEVFHIGGGIVGHLENVTQPIGITIISYGLIKYFFKQKHHIEKIKTEKQAYYDDSIKDSLTGLYNRKYLNEYYKLRSSQDETQKSSHALVLIDIDDFKKVNDTYGHIVGDKAINVVSNCIKKAIRNEHDIAVRYGGDEFILLLPDGDYKTARTIATRIRRNISESTITLDNQDIFHLKDFTLSFGVALQKDNESLEAFVERADKAMYAAKKKGKDQIVFD